MRQRARILRKSILLIPFFWTCALARLSPEPNAMPAGEIGKIAFSDAFRVRLETKNDSIASLSNGDWDDLRTFGMYLGAAWKDWTIELTADSLTNRAENEEGRGRVDELYGTISRRLLSRSLGIFSIQLSAGAGALFLGDFYGHEIQSAFHSYIGNRRPIPDRYDEVDSMPTIVGQAMSRIRIDAPIAPILFLSSVEVGDTGFLRVASFAESGELDNLPGLSVYAGGMYARNYREFGTTFAKTVDSENGIYIGTRIDTGSLEAGFSYNLSTSRQAGYLALSFPAEKTRGDSTGANGVIESVDFNLRPFQSSIRVRTTFWRFQFPERLALCPIFGVDAGTFLPAHTDKDEAINYRYEECYAGLDFSREIFSWMDGYLMGAGGVRKEQMRTRTIEASRVIDDRISGLGVAECGVRLRLPAIPRMNCRWGFGFGGGFRYAKTFDEGFIPYGQVRLIAMIGQRE